VKPNEKVKLRVLNGGLSLMSLHPHGQALTETHVDGIEVPTGAQLTRDVIAIAAAQRVDLLLDLTNDGLHSYGDGVWLLHDHNEHAFTTDGVSPGGDVSAIAYDSFLDANGWPVTHGIDWRPFFSPDYYRRKIPVWVTYDDMKMLARPAARDSRRGGSSRPAFSSAGCSRWCSRVAGREGEALKPRLLSLLAAVLALRRSSSPRTRQSTRATTCRAWTWMPAAW